MYILFVILIFIYACAFMVSLGKRLPGELKKQGLMVIFYRLAALIVDSKSYKNKMKKSRSLKKMSMLFPAINPYEKMREYEIKRMGLALLVIFAGIVLGLLLTINNLMNSPLKNEYLIPRNDYGNGSKSVELSIYADGEMISDSERIKVGERQYTDEEITKKYNEFIPILEKNVLGKNLDFEDVVYDLNFINSIDGYPFLVEWELSNYTVISREGKIYQDNTVEEGTPISITAVVTYYSFHEEYMFNAMIYPLPQNSEESYYEEVVKEIDEYEKASLIYEDLILPNSINGKEISYKVVNNNNSGMMLVLFLFFAMVIFRASEKDTDKEIIKRDNQMMMDYPKIISKFNLLVEAGMTIQAAFRKITKEYEIHKNKTGMRFAYEEMLITVREMESGINEGEAFANFGNRCRLQKYVKFGALLSQNLKKGSNGLLINLAAEEKDAFEERKSMARKLGEEAGTKLLLPMVIMLGIVMIIVIVPAFLSFTF